MTYKYMMETFLWTINTHYYLLFIINRKHAYIYAENAPKYAWTLGGAYVLPQTP